MRSYELVDEILVLVDIDDPMTHELEFHNRVRYGGFARGCSQLSERNRELIREAAKDPLMPEAFHRKFIIEVFTDKLVEMMQALVFSKETSRSLTYLGTIMKTLMPEGLDEEDASEYDLPVNIRHIYVLATVGELTFTDMPETADGSTTMTTETDNIPADPDFLFAEESALVLDESELEEPKVETAQQTHNPPKILH